jgi:hypothetical protein
LLSLLKKRCARRVAQGGEPLAAGLTFVTGSGAEGRKPKAAALLRPTPKTDG